MKTLTTKDANCGFGWPIDLARVNPMAVSKHGRPVVVVLAAEEFDRLAALDAPPTVAARKRKAKE